MAGASDDAVISIRITPRAARDAPGPWRGGRLRIRLPAQPVDGRVTAALCRLLAETLDVPPSRGQAVRGVRGREKSVRIDRHP